MQMLFASAGKPRFSPPANLQGLFVGNRKKGFVPPVTAGLVLSLIADNITVSDGSNVPTWPDASGAGNDATQVTSSKQPVLHRTGGSNGRASVVFDGVDDIMTAPVAGVQPYTVLIVGHAGFGLGNQYFVDGDAVNTGVIGNHASNTQFQIYAGGNAFPPGDPTSYGVICVVFNGTSSIFSLNGSTAAINVGTGNAAGTTIGNSGAGDNIPLNGPLCAVFKFNRALTPTEVASMSAALKTYYATP